MNEKGKCDPYVWLVWGNKTYKTPTVYKSTEPSWENVSFEFTCSSFSDTLEVSVWDKTRLARHEFRGKVVLSLKQYLDPSPSERWFPLEPKDRKKERHSDKLISGEILLRFESDAPLHSASMASFPSSSSLTVSPPQHDHSSSSSTSTASSLHSESHHPPLNSALSFSSS